MSDDPRKPSDRGPSAPVACDQSMTCECALCTIERDHAVACGVRGNPSNVLPPRKGPGFNPRKAN